MSRNKKLDDNLPNIKSKNSSTRYSSGEKIDALVWLDAGRNLDTGDLNPNFLQVSRRLNIADNTLRNWWKQRDVIIRQAGAEIATLSDIMQVELAVEVKKILRELNTRGYEKFSDRDLISALKEFHMQFRLVSGQATQIMQTARAVDYVPVLPEYKPGLIDLGAAKVIDHKTEETKDNETK